MRFTAQQKILASLIVASLAIFFWGLGSIPLLSFNEARRAVPVREMLATRNLAQARASGDRAAARTAETELQRLRVKREVQP